MGVSFLVPAFLLGLAALAVPVLVHLIHRERSSTVQFPSLMFLQRIPFRSVRRQRIRHWLLLLLRCLALALVALAFARPFLRRAGLGSGAVGGARAVVILLDRSYSMGFTGRWPAAQAAAERVIAGLEPGDQASLVVFDEEARALGQPTGDRARLRAELATTHVGWGRTRFAPALDLAGSLLAAAHAPRREAVLISDFQESAWDPGASSRLPPGVRLTPVPVEGDTSAANVAVTSVSFRREALRTAERVVATARLANVGPKAVADLAVSLDLDGRAVETRHAALAPGAATTVSFAPFLVPSPTRGAVRIGDDALAADNVFDFVLAPDQAVPVLVLDGPDPGRSFYLRRALAIGQTPGFRVQVKPARRLDAADLTRSSVVVLDDAPIPTGELGRRLMAWVAAGGGLVVVLGPNSRATQQADSLFGTIGRVVQPEEGNGAALGSLDFSHAIFEPFAAPHSGDFSAARFFGRRQLTPVDSATVLARFDDGSAALVERRSGAGRVLVWASTLDTSWNDLALQPVFLPFVHQLVRYAAGYAPPPSWRTVGDVWDPARDRDPGDLRTGTRGAAMPSGDQVVVSPQGERVAAAATVGGRAAVGVRLLERGFYEARTDGGSTSAVIAVNVDPAESQPARMDPQELVAAATSPGTVQTTMSASRAPADRERMQSWWWYLLAGAALLLATETAISNRLSRAGG